MWWILADESDCGCFESLTELHWAASLSADARSDLQFNSLPKQSFTSVPHPLHSSELMTACCACLAVSSKAFLSHVLSCAAALSCLSGLKTCLFDSEFQRDRCSYCCSGLPGGCTDQTVSGFGFETPVLRACQPL